MTTATPANPPPESTTAPAMVADKLADFSDRLSPMLVKELRQGLRAKTFVSVFLTLQILLGSVMLIAMAGSGQDPQKAGSAISSIVFCFFGLAMLVIQPIRGIGALHREVHHNTIELMVLTRLNAWKIVLGKWVSLVAQSALLLAAIAPYLVLRYWLGGMDLLGELSLLCLVFVVSAVFTAIIVGISCLPSMIIRGLLPLIGAALLITPVFSIPFDDYAFPEFISWAAGNSPGGFAAVAAFVAGAAYLGWTALGIGVSMIAPIVENHSTLKRLVGLGMLLLTLLATTVIDAPSGVWAVMACLVAIPAIILAFAEPFFAIGPLTARFLDRGPAGYLAAAFLHPGWAPGVLFSMLMIGLVAAIVHFGSAGATSPAEWIVLLAISGSLILPAIIIAPWKLRQRFATYLLIMVAMGLITVVFSILASAVGSPKCDFLWWLAWLPPINLTMLEFSTVFAEEDILRVSLWWNAGYAIALTLIALVRLRDLTKVEIPETESP